jgi:DNA repair exonuclease SbcCD nuclease subunit
MRLLHFADLHLDTPFRWAPPELARARRQALRTTLMRMCRLAADLHADVLCCAGDLYEQERFTPDTAEFLRSSFEQLSPLPVLLAPGNHDWFGPMSLYHQVNWSSNVRVFTEDRLQPVELAAGLTIWGAAHRAPANTRGFLNDFRVDRGGVNLALFHGSEQGELAFQEEGKLPHAPFHAAQITMAGLDHALLGHFHVPRDAARHTYPGNPDPLTFGESEGRGAVLVTIAADGSVTRERHQVATSVVSDVPVELTGVTYSGQVADRVLAAVAGRSGVVRATLAGEIGPDVDLRLQDLAALSVPQLDALLPRLGKISFAYDFERLKDEQTVRGEFVRDVVADSSLSDDQRRRVLVTGLRALDGRADELEVH